MDGQMHHVSFGGDLGVGLYLGAPPEPPAGDPNGPAQVRVNRVSATRAAQLGVAVAALALLVQTGVGVVTGISGWWGSHTLTLTPMDKKFDREERSWGYLDSLPANYWDAPSTPFCGSFVKSDGYGDLKRSLGNKRQYISVVRAPSMTGKTAAVLEALKELKGTVLYTGSRSQFGKAIRTPINYDENLLDLCTSRIVKRLDEWADEWERQKLQAPVWVVWDEVLTVEDVTSEAFWHTALMRSLERVQERRGFKARVVLLTKSKEVGAKIDGYNGPRMEEIQFSQNISQQEAKEGGGDWEKAWEKAKAALGKRVTKIPVTTVGDYC